MKSHCCHAFAHFSTLTEESVYLVKCAFSTLKTVILPFKLLSDACLLLSILWIFMGIVALTHCHSLTTTGRI